MKKKIIICVLASLIGLMFILPANSAESTLQDTTALIDWGITIVWDNQVFVPTDANGNVVPTIIYENRVFIPLRSYGVQSGSAVAWDPDTRTINITSPTALDQEVQTEAEDTEETAIQATTSFTSDFGEPKNIILDGEMTGWQYWVRNDNVYMEYHEAIALITESNSGRLDALNYYPDSKIFNVGSKSSSVEYYLEGNYKLINISAIDRIYGSIIISLNTDSGEVISQ